MKKSRGIFIFFMMLGIWLPAAGQESVYLPVGENQIFHAEASSYNNFDGRPTVASNGTVFFVAWRTNSGPITFTRVSNTGTVLDMGGIVLGAGSSYPTAVWNGTNFFCVWVNGTSIVGARVNPDGTVVDATPLSLVPQADSNSRPCPIAFDGTNYLIVWRTTSSQVRAARIGLDGTLLDPDSGFLLGSGFYPWVIWGNGEYFVVWHAWGSQGLDIYGARVSTAGAVVAPGAFLISSRPADQDHASAAFDGTNYLVVWAEAPHYNDLEGELYAARVSPSGAVLDATPTLLEDRYARSIACPVIYDGDSFLIVWKRANGFKNFRLADLFARRIRGDGTFVDAAPFPLSTTYWHQFNPVVGYGGGLMCAAWFDTRTGIAPSGTGLVMGQVMQKTALPGNSNAARPMPPAAPDPPANGSPWTQAPSPVSNQLYNIVGVNPEFFCIAGNGYNLKLDNGVWTHWASNGQAYYGIWADSNQVIKTIGWCWSMTHCLGGVWDQSGCQDSGIPVNPYQIGFGVWGDDVNNLMTVGSDGSYGKYNGSDWEMGNAGTTYCLFDVWGTAMNNIYAVGEAGTVLHYDGAAWSKVPNVPTQQCLTAIWGMAGNDIFVVGDFGAILHYDGSTWSAMASGTAKHLYDLAGFNGHDVYAVGIEGTILHYDGFDWQAEASGTQTDLFGVAAAGATVWAVGDTGIILKKEASAPTIGLSKTTFDFGAEQNGTATPNQTVMISNTGQGTLNWLATSSAGWLQAAPGSGTGAGVLTIGIVDTSLAPGTYQGTVTVSDPAATNNPQVITVNYQVYDSGTNSPPFGAFDTPADRTTVASSIPVTGWALDNVGVQSVKIYRGTGAEDRAFIGDAVFVEGARPDVEGSYPGYPQSSRAGWGYMLLTNFLPLGDGPYNLLAYATDIEGNEVLLGSKAITVNNAQAVLPFGAIDTPAQGGTASGNPYFNFGWVLTPMPNWIPVDGSTIMVWVDGLPLGHPSYNHYRGDIASMFPGYVNSDGAVGLYNLDTTAYENGVHTIAWSAMDSAGNVDGIGSRYFSILNAPGAPGAGGMGERDGGTEKSFGAGPGDRGAWSRPLRRTAEEIESMPEDVRAPVFVRRGWAADAWGGVLAAGGKIDRGGKSGVSSDAKKSKTAGGIASMQAGVVLPDSDGAIRVEMAVVGRLAVYLNETDSGETIEEMKERRLRILAWNENADCGGISRSDQAAEDPAVGSKAEISGENADRHGRYEAYELVLGRLRPIPVGASFDPDAATLYWQPGPGFLGEFCFMIIDSEAKTKRTIRVEIKQEKSGPKPS